MIRIFYILTAVLLLSFGLITMKPLQAAAQASSSKPNVLFILLDNVGKDWFRCYGSQENQTPHIDRLSRTGMTFRNCYVTPVCSTTRVMLLSGRYPFTTGWHTHHDPAIYGGGYYDWKREVSMARVMQSAGYDTCISGKWQINDLFDPEQQNALTKHGFDEYCIFPEGKKGHPAHKKRYWDPYVIKNGKQMETKGKFGPDIFTDYLLDYIKKDRDKPFFAYYSTIMTHIPVVSTPHNKGKELTSRQKFAGMLNYADHLIGKLEKGLEAAGKRDNTIIFIVVDNGTDKGTDQKDPQDLGGLINGRNGGEGIYSLTEEGINMPLIVNCPKLIRQGYLSDRLVDASDFLPTVVALGKGSLPKGVQIDGRSFADELLGLKNAKKIRPWCLTQYYKTRVVRNQRFKLYSTGQFYDLSADPLERHNLSNPKLSFKDQTIQAGYQQLSDVLTSLPENAKLPWEFRSISARKIRKQEADAKQRKQAFNK